MINLLTFTFSGVIRFYSDELVERLNLRFVQSAFNLGEDDNGEYTELRKEAFMQLQSTGDASPSLFFEMIEAEMHRKKDLKGFLFDNLSYEPSFFEGLDKMLSKNQTNISLVILVEINFVDVVESLIAESNGQFTVETPLIQRTIKRYEKRKEQMRKIGGYYNQKGVPFLQFNTSIHSNEEIFKQIESVLL